jgi:7,8-dihydropterin-6-yl-methyl-4-(beta-D-ribofuranosyl)aminobenzene 5'-phosphate synthase
MQLSGSINLSYGLFLIVGVLFGSIVAAEDSRGNFIAIIYNNVLGDMTAGVRTGPGFSAFIRFRGKSIIFDTGADAAGLRNNIQVMNLDCRNLDAVVISHNHWDHVYGLPAIYEFIETNPAVYVPSSAKDAISKQNPGATVVPVEEAMQIFPNIWSTGSIPTQFQCMPLAEQSLILDSDDSLHIITGCAHPGIVTIVEHIRKLFPGKPIALVTGGFHLVNATKPEIMEMSARLTQLGVKKVAPSHCTGRLATEAFKEDWKENYIPLYLGHTYRF